MVCCTADAKPAKLKYTGAFPSKNSCVLPAVDSTTVGKRVVDMFAKIQHGQTLQQVQKQIDLAPIVPKLYKSLGFPMTTLSYDIPLAEGFILVPNVSFNQNLKANSVTIGLVQNFGKENQKNCYWELVPVK